MEQLPQLLALMDRPAFCVNNGIIIAVNHAAHALTLTEGMRIDTLLSSGRDAYAEFTEGCLGLELSIHGTPCTAAVTVTRWGHLVTLEPESANADLRMLALAAQSLRDPLSEVMALAAALPEDAPKRAELSRGLHRILRIVGNMTPHPTFRPELVELNALLRELWDKAQPACDAAGIRFTFVPSPAPIYTAVDSGLLTRAIHNLLSNSMKFSQAKDLRLELLRSGNSCRIRWIDPGAELPPDPFARYLREPGLEDPRFGLGLGLHLVQNAISAHHGSALMTAAKGGGVVTELRLSMKQDLPLHSPRYPISYTGAWDPLLVELSDVLPPEFYQ